MVSLKKKMLFVISGLSIFSCVVGILVTSNIAIKQIEKDTLERAKSDLTAKRELVSSELKHYLDTIEKQAIVMAEDVSIKEAISDFTQAFDDFPEDAGNIEAIKRYYREQFKAKFEQINRQTVDTSLLYQSLSPTAIALQSQFIALNPSSIGHKDQLDSIDDGSLYDQLHQRYHPTIRKFLQEFGYYDIFLVEPKQGNIVYSVFKELDFATSLDRGPYRNSGIAEAYHQALTLKQGETYITDFKKYLPSYNQAASFISAPIYHDDALLGVLIFQFPIDKVNDILTQNKQWQSRGFGQTGEVYLVGQDHTWRSNSRFFIEHRQDYLNDIRVQDADLAREIELKNSPIILQTALSSSVDLALQGESGFDIHDDYRGIPVLSAFAPIDVGSHRWAIMADIDKAEAYANLEQTRGYIWQTAAITIICVVTVAVLLSLMFANTLTKPLNVLATRFESLSQGEADLTSRLDQSTTPEIQRSVSGFNQFISQVASVFGNVKDSVARIASSSTELGATIEQTSVTLDEQKRSVAQVRQSVSEFKSAVYSINDQTEVALTEAQQARDNTEHCSNRATNAVDNISQLVNELQDSSQSMASLQASVEQISSVLEVINSIAEQTNLLALNAAIESARAGEYGRGFAVVADEVRSLASRTQESTVTISTKMNQLVETVQLSAQSMTRANKSAESGIELVEDVHHSLRDLQISIEKLSGMSADIATSTQSQSQNIERIDETISLLENRASEISDASLNIAQVAHELSDVAENLESETNRYKV
ncbi:MULTISPECIES: methyl-accepting chemotaxis protein [unclassified Vibrio]|uniref:Methyl-accepting chemotaxis protein n=1 Tax=Vibrio sp. HB236076 TaxID=3232307 RepID=A0AB39HBZ1_9VIBR|nr:methyl-accepting chemotaxis protein [Vibrio sp. HB161653]MDP5254142.1 methyl-accepting chemotaxis protein [Vibrio sp. HB161653]